MCFRRRLISYRNFHLRHLVALFVVAGALLATSLAPGAAALAAPPVVPVTMTVEIEASEDIGVIESVPTFTGGAPYFVLNSRPGGDRGYAQPFKTGETEDFLYYPAGVAGGGADFDVRQLPQTRCWSSRSPRSCAASP